jgi:hypothetical protein
MLASNAVSHNHLQFRRYAIDACLAAGDWAGADRHAASLDAFTAGEPLPWASFFSARGRVLAACGAGMLSPSLGKELQGLCKEARRLGFIEAGRAIEAAVEAGAAA